MNTLIITREPGRLATTQVVEQWGLYDGYDPKLEKVLRRRRTGRHMPIMNVIPPGLDFSNLKVLLPLRHARHHLLAHPAACPVARRGSVSTCRVWRQSLWCSRFPSAAGLLMEMQQRQRYICSCIRPIV